MPIPTRRQRRHNPVYILFYCIVAPERRLTTFFPAGVCANKAVFLLFDLPETEGQSGGCRGRKKRSDLHSSALTRLCRLSGPCRTRVSAPVLTSERIVKENIVGSSRSPLVLWEGPGGLHTSAFFFLCSQTKRKKTRCVFRQERCKHARSTLALRGLISVWLPAKNSSRYEGDRQVSVMNVYKCQRLHRSRLQCGSSSSSTVHDCFTHCVNGFWTKNQNKI